MTRRWRRSDAGFTMIELLVGMVLTSVIGALLLGSALGARKVTDDARLNSELTADVRRAMERLVRELRQASTIDQVDLPATSDGTTAITFRADFNNDGDDDDTSADDPEILTYRHVPASGQITLTAQGASGMVTTPVLAENVTAFSISLRSSQWQHDSNADGIVDWSELDLAAAPVGNQNGKPDGAELARITSVVLTVSVDRGGRNQDYRTQVDLRNRHVA